MALGVAVRPGLHFSPPWSLWLDVRGAQAEGTENTTLGSFQTTASVRATFEPFALEVGMGVAHVWRTLDDAGDDVRLRRTGIAFPVRAIGGWNLGSPRIGLTMGV